MNVECDANLSTPKVALEAEERDGRSSSAPAPSLFGKTNVCRDLRAIHIKHFTIASEDYCRG